VGYGQALPGHGGVAEHRRLLEELVVESEEAMIMESSGKDEAWRNLQIHQDTVGLFAKRTRKGTKPDRFGVETARREHSEASIRINQQYHFRT